MKILWRLEVYVKGHQVPMTRFKWTTDISPPSVGTSVAIFRKNHGWQFTVQEVHLHWPDNKPCYKVTIGHKNHGSMKELGPMSKTLKALGWIAVGQKR